MSNVYFSTFFNNLKPYKYKTTNGNSAYSTQRSLQLSQCKRAGEHAQQCAAATPGSRGCASTAHAPGRSSRNWTPAEGRWGGLGTPPPGPTLTSGPAN